MALSGCNQNETSSDDQFIGRQQPEIKARQFTPELLWAMGRIGGYDVSPDGKTLVYNVSYYSVEANTSHTVIYTQEGIDDIANAQEHLLTEASTSELSPQFIEDGTKIAFLAPDDDGNMQIWSMNTDGSSRKKLSDEAEGIDEFKFSPDGGSVLFVKTMKSGERTSDLYPDLDKASGRVIDGLMYRHWDEWVESIPRPFVAQFDGSAITDAKDLLGTEPYE